MIEIPPMFAGKPPVSLAHSRQGSKTRELDLERHWPGTTGLAEDVSRYGAWMRDEAFKRIGNLYPPIEITKEIVKDRTDLKQFEGEKLTVIAWLWVRTIKSPNPAFSHVDVPLASTFILSRKDGKDAYVQAAVQQDSYQFIVRLGKAPPEAKTGTKAARGSNFRCILSGSPISAEYIMDYAKSHAGLGTRLMAIVAEGIRGRIYLSPSDAEPVFTPPDDLSFLDLEITNDRRWFSPPLYGMPKWKDLFTSRQLIALTTFSDLIGEARGRIWTDSIAAGLPNDDCSLDAGGVGAKAYAEAVSTYLAMATSRWSDMSNTICSWNTTNQNVRALFARQAIPMSWDYVELSPFGSVGPWYSSVESMAQAMISLPATSACTAIQANATDQKCSSQQFVSTDPPYYDNIGYADLSDFFYVWLRRSLRSVFPDLLATISVPKAEELVATPYRHGGKLKAEQFFLDGMTKAMHNLAVQAHPAAPVTIYYAFKQSETESAGTNSTGWETFLEAVLKSGLSITGTWPMRTERAERSVSLGTNSLASSIILVCRTRASNAGKIGRRQFVRMLNDALPLALDAMTRKTEGLHSPVAPVDLSQAIIGPGMAIFSRYETVLEADGSPMTVKVALRLINRFLAEDDFDADTQFCLHWFEQFGWEAGNFGEADTLARAKGTSVDGVKQSGVLHAAGGNVRLLKWAEYPTDWDPQTDQRLPIWEVLHQLIRVFSTEGESKAGAVLAAVQSQTEAARQLAYRLYTLCERANLAEDARAYNELITSWSGIESAAAKAPAATQRTLFE